MSSNILITEAANYLSRLGRQVVSQAQSYIGEAKKPKEKEEDNEEQKNTYVKPSPRNWTDAKRVYGVPSYVNKDLITGYANHYKTGKRGNKKQLVTNLAHGLAIGAANFSSQFTTDQKAEWKKNLIAQRAAAKKAREGSN